MGEVGCKNWIKKAECAQKANILNPVLPTQLLKLARNSGAFSVLYSADCMGSKFWQTNCFTAVYFAVFDSCWFFWIKVLFIQPWIENISGRSVKQRLTLTYFYTLFQQQKFWNCLCELKWCHARKLKSLCIIVSQIVIPLFFLLDNPLCERLRLPKPSVRRTLPLIPQRALTSFSPPALCLWLEFPAGTQMSLAHFLSFCRGQTGETPVGSTL